MRFLRHLFGLIGQLLAFSVATRRISLLLVLVAGLVLTAVTLAGQAAAPFVVYPFL
ncbi:MAG: hypothetical protein U0P45_07735 [Acidimicrobiales bacterium]